MSQNSPKPQILSYQHELKAFYYLPSLSVEIGSIPFPYLVEWHAPGINSLLVSSLTALQFSNLLCQAKKFDMNKSFRIIFFNTFISIKINFIKFYSKNKYPFY